MYREGFGITETNSSSKTKRFTISTRKNLYKTIIYTVDEDLLVSSSTKILFCSCHEWHLTLFFRKTSKVHVKKRRSHEAFSKATSISKPTNAVTDQVIFSNR